MFFVSVLCCFKNFVDHGGRRGDMAQALARWRHPVASSELLDVLYWTMLGGPAIKYSPSAPFFQFLVRPPYQKFLFSELWRWALDRQFMTNWASTTRPPNHHPCTFSCMKLWFQHSDALSFPLEDPDRGTDEAAICSGKCTQC